MGADAYANAPDCIYLILQQPARYSRPYTYAFELLTMPRHSPVCAEVHMNELYEVHMNEL